MKCKYEGKHYNMMSNSISKCLFIIYFFYFCVECPNGYIGVNCSHPCNPPLYGNLCSLSCECVKCHHIYGCVTGKSITTNYDVYVKKNCHWTYSSQFFINKHGSFHIFIQIDLEYYACILISK